MGSLDLGLRGICRHGTETKGAWWHAGVDGMDGMNATYPKLVRSFVTLVSKRIWGHWSATLSEIAVQMTSKCVPRVLFFNICVPFRIFLASHGKSVSEAAASSLQASHPKLPPWSSHFTGPRTIFLLSV